MWGKFFRAFNVFRFRWQIQKVGRNFRIGVKSTIVTPFNVEIGSDVFIGPGFYLSSPAVVRIGDRVMFGPQVMIIGGDHDISKGATPLRFRPAGATPPPIHIKEDAWIGARVIILKGVTIGTGAVVGAGSVVTRDIPDFAVAVGNPCRVVRQRPV